jgi:hypothetical protein
MDMDMDMGMGMGMGMVVVMDTMKKIKNHNKKENH